MKISRFIYKLINLEIIHRCKGRFFIWNKQKESFCTASLSQKKFVSLQLVFSIHVIRIQYFHQRGKG